MPKAKPKTSIIPLSVTSLISKIVHRLKNYRPSRRDSLFLIIAGLLILAYFNKGWFIAATVNGQPITTIELQRQISRSYREQVLNQIIGEKILEQEANKKGAHIVPAELQAKVSADEAAYGGKEIFEMLLAQQGLTRIDYEARVKSIILIEKLYSSEIKPTEEELKSFMQENSSLPEATDEAKFKSFATEQLSQQKLSKVFSEKFSELRKSADIKYF